MSTPTGRPVASVEALAREFWAHFDAKDHQGLVGMMTDDALETDDLAKVWLRGRTAIAEHFAAMGKRYVESETALEDVKVTETPGMAVLTCVVLYQMKWDGEPGSWQWTTTMIFLRNRGAWRIALLHTK